MRRMFVKGYLKKRMEERQTMGQSNSINQIYGDKEEDVCLTKR